MSLDVSINDILLHPFLMAKDVNESQRQLLILLSEHAEPRMRGIILARLRSFIIHEEHLSHYEDLYSESKTRLVTYLHELKDDIRSAPCKDFRGYAAAIAHNACHDYFRDVYPARARLQKSIRDLLQAHPNFALWKAAGPSKDEWFCGFYQWRGRSTSYLSIAWLRRFYEDPKTTVEILAADSDIQTMPSDQLLAVIFNDLGEPLNLNDLINVVAGIRGVKDRPLASFDEDGIAFSLRLSDSRIRVDSVLEMRAPLMIFWKSLSELPSDQLRAYLLYARDQSGEDLISLLLAARIATEMELAEHLRMSLEELRDLRSNRLPLNNEEISNELGVTIQRVYKLRFRAGQRLKSSLAKLR
jgi:RNA polymerase sigma factor (sigma-70 family)